MDFHNTSMQFLLHIMNIENALHTFCLRNHQSLLFFSFNMIVYKIQSARVYSYPFNMFSHMVTWITIILDLIIPDHQQNYHATKHPTLLGLVIHLASYKQFYHACFPNSSFTLLWENYYHGMGIIIFIHFESLSSLVHSYTIIQNFPQSLGYFGSHPH